MRELLSYVRRPARYIGPEPNAIVKQHNSVKLKTVLVYPDLYEVGIANLGLKILYELINDLPYALAERAYLPGSDMEEMMKRHAAKLSSIETDTPLDEFDIIGITLQTELNYANALRVMKLSGLEARSGKRKKLFPLVLGGGSCAFSPEPVADFFDAFVIGDGEEAIKEIIDIVIQCKDQGLSRESCLNMLSSVKGVYVPSLYKQVIDGQDTFKGIVPYGKSTPGVKRRILPGINSSALKHALIPFLKPVHDRLVVEIARGCTKGCRFCQAGMIYRPVREKDMDTVLKEIKQNIDVSGFSDISLLSLSAGDYTRILPLLKAFMSEFIDDRCSLSLPSLRIDSVADSMLEQIKQVRKTGFTVAIEAGTQRMRNIINKNITEEEILASVELAAKKGWQTIKLYFMLGLPLETDDDVTGMGELIKRIHAAVRKNNRKTRINASISAFIPKPHTPFQWAEMITPGEFRRRLYRVKDIVRKTGVVIKHQTPEISVIEAVLARADRRMGPVIEDVLAHELKSTATSGISPEEETRKPVDDPSSGFDYQVWLDALKSHGLSLSDLIRERTADESLPWDHIDTFIPKSFLRQEYEKSRSQLLTEDCFQAVCTDCGVCDFKYIEPVASKEPMQKTPGAQKAIKGPEEEPNQWTTNVRVHYAKSGLIRFLGHLELMDFLMHAIHRAKLPLAYTSGFHPKPIVSFSDPIPVGIESSAEYIDIKLYGNIDAGKVLEALKKYGHQGLEFMNVTLLPYGARPAGIAVKAVHYELMLDAVSSCSMSVLRSAIDLFLSSKIFMVSLNQKKKTGEFDIRPFIEALGIDRTGKLFMVIKRVDNRLIGPVDIIEKGLGILYHDIINAPLKKVGVEFED